MDGRSLTSASNGLNGGRPRLEASKLREALIREAEARADELAAVLMDKAISGDIPAIKEMIDRALGRAIQAHNVNIQTPQPILDIDAVKAKAALEAQVTGKMLTEGEGVSEGV